VFGGFSAKSLQERIVDVGATLVIAADEQMRGGKAIPLKPAIDEAFATGMTRRIQEPLYANFMPYDLRPEERELAMATWTWNGFYQQMDEVTQVAPDYRIGVFDSDRAAELSRWDEDTKAYIESELIKICDLRPEDYKVVPVTMIAPPWPKYDEFRGSVPALMRKLVEEGHDLDDVLAYEKAVQGREKIVQALEELISEGGELSEAELEEEVVA